MGFFEIAIGIASAVGAATSGISAVQAANESERQQEQALANAKAEENASRLEASRFEREARRRKGTTVAGLLASGGTLDNFQDVLSDQSLVEQRNAGLITLGGDFRAEEQRALAGSFGRQSRAQLIGGAFNAAVPVASAAGKIIGPRPVPTASAN